MEAVFANSLLSLISPWGHSPVSRHLSPPRRARPVAPPPLPRRHSDPTHTTASTNTHSRHSEIKNPKLDLRQELQNLNLNRQEFVGWLGNEFEEKDEEYEPYHEQFKHDIPLQRSLSLDGGIEIFKYLQEIGSDWSGTEIGSCWTVNSDERESLVFEQYRSFEDIPASQFRVKSRRVSYMDTFGRSLALSVLKDSYKGMDMDGGSISPQIKKLRRCFTFPDKLEEFKEAVRSSVENLDEVFLDSKTPSPKPDIGSRSGLQRVKMLHRSLSFRNSTEDFCNKTDDVKLEVTVPFYRSISMESTKGEMMRQRRVGVTDLCQGIKKEVNLRKEVLMKRNLSEFKSCDNISVKSLKSRRSSAETNASQISKLDGVVGIGNISPGLLKLRTFTNPKSAHKHIPTIVITDTESLNNVAKSSPIPMTSNSLETRCDCSICTEVTEVKDRSFASKMLSKLFMKIVSGREMGRRLTYRDENNNDSDMYKCIMNVLKLLLGLWLRHLDHN